MSRFRTKGTCWWYWTLTLSLPEKNCAMMLWQMSMLMGTYVPKPAPLFTLAQQAAMWGQCWCYDHAGRAAIVTLPFAWSGTQTEPILQTVCRFTYSWIYTLSAAQPTTVGKRATLWLHDVLFDIEETRHVLDLLLPLIKGHNGHPSFFSWPVWWRPWKGQGTGCLCGQSHGLWKGGACFRANYSRKQDSMILNLLSQIAQTAYKFSNDLRLLQHLKEVEEPLKTSDRLFGDALQAQSHALREDGGHSQVSDCQCAKRCHDRFPAMASSAHLMIAPTAVLVFRKAFSGGRLVGSFRQCSRRPGGVS